MGLMNRLLRRRRTLRLPRPRGRGPTTVRPSDAADERHLNDFASTRRGVEGFVEPRTAISDVTLLLVAHDGEWTRRRIDSASAARDLGHRLGIPVYDVALVGYPQRMRDYTARQNRENRRGRHENLGS